MIHKLNIKSIPDITIFLLILLFSVLTFSCEDVIQVDLNSTDPKIVIEGIITDHPDYHLVRISRSTDYFTPENFDPVTGAEVTLSDDTGNSEVLMEGYNGIYETSLIQGMPGRTYTLTVLYEGKEYSAVSTMPEAVEIDSLVSEYYEGIFGVKGYIVHCYFQDRENVDDYCRINVIHANIRHYYYHLYQDRLTDGIYIDYDIFNEDFKPGNEVSIELLTLNKAAFEYYSTVNFVIAAGDEGGGGGFQSAPANPVTNLSNGAFGYFATYTFRKQTVIIE